MSWLSPENEPANPCSGAGLLLLLKTCRTSLDIRNAYPDLWTETIRGLLVHSARWSEAMLGLVDPRRAGSTEAVQRIVRVFGFGIQNAQRSILSGENDAFFSLAK
jgi:hypothetical protein